MKRPREKLMLHSHLIFWSPNKRLFLVTLKPMAAAVTVDRHPPSSMHKCCTPSKVLWEVQESRKEPVVSLGRKN